LTPGIEETTILIPRGRRAADRRPASPALDAWHAEATPNLEKISEPAAQGETDGRQQEV